MKKATIQAFIAMLFFSFSINAQCIAHGGDLLPPDPVNSFEGSPLLDLPIAPDYPPLPITSPIQGTFPLVGYNEGIEVHMFGPICVELPGTPKAYEFFEFEVDTDGDYSFTFFPFGLGWLSGLLSDGTLILVEGSYNGNGVGLCGNPGFLGSSCVNGDHQNSMTIPDLEANQVYTLIIAADQAILPLLFQGYSVDITGPPNWDFVHPTNEPPSPPYGYMYLVEDLNSNDIIAALPTPDLTITPPGEYCVHGFSYLPPQIDPTTLVGSTIAAVQADIDADTYCAALSSNCVSTTITPCPTLSITAVTQPHLCGENGVIELAFTDVPNGTYTITYDGGQFDGVVVTSQAASITTPEGDYNNLRISVNGCLSDLGQSISIESNDPNDQDCDGVDAAIDCDDNDDTITNTNVDDADCDGVTTTVDCDDNDPSIGGPVAPGTLCDDNNPLTILDIIQLDGCTCDGAVGIIAPADPASPIVSDPCACNNDQSANGAGDGTFSERIVVDMNGIHGMSICASQFSTGIYDVAGVDLTNGNTTDVPFTEIGGGLYELEFNHIDAIGYTVNIVECTTGLPIYDVAGAPLAATNVCYYPVIEYIGETEFCANDELVFVEGFADLTAGSSGLGFSAETFEYFINGSGTAADAFDPETLGVGIHSIQVVYTPDEMIGNAVDQSAPTCPTELLQTFEVLQFPVVNTDFNSAVICEGESIEIDGAFSGSASSASWSSTGDGLFDDPTMLNTTYHPGADDIIDGGFILILTSDDPPGPCVPDMDEIEVVINPAATADAGADITACSDGVVSLSATASGPGEWSGGLGSFELISDVNTNYTPHADEAGTVVTLSWTTYDPDASGPCGDVSDDVDITIDVAAEVSAGPDVISCEGNNVFLDAASYSGSTSSVTWSSTDGNFSDENSLVTLFTPSADQVDEGFAILTLTSNDPDGPCDAVSDDMVIFFNTDALALAGDDQTVCGLIPVELNAITNGSGTWTGGLGSFSDTSEPQAEYTPHADELGTEVVLTWTTDDPDGPGPCMSANDDVSVWFNVPAEADAGDDITVCGIHDIQLNAVSNVPGFWSGGNGSYDNNTLNDAIYSPSNDEEGTSFQLTFTTLDPDDAGPCPAVSDFLIITINEGVTVSAGPDQTVCGLVDVTLDAASNVPGLWTGGLGSFDDNSETNTIYTPHNDELNTTVQLSWTTIDPDGDGPCESLTDVMEITFDLPATVDLGDDFTVCGEGPVDLLAIVGGSATSGYWSSDEGGFATVDPNGLDVEFTPSENQINDGFAVLTFETNDPEGICDAASDELIVHFNEAPVAFVSVPNSSCGTAPFEVSVGSNTSGLWSGGLGTFDNPLQLTTNYNPHESELGVTVQLTWTSIDSDGDGPCTATSDFGDVSIEIPAIVDIPEEVLICEDEHVSIEALVGGSTESVGWSTLGDGSFIDENALAMTYIPGANDIANGEVVLVVVTNDPDGICEHTSDEVVVHINHLLHADAGNDILACGYSIVPLNANLIEGIWSGGLGSFDNPAHPNTTYTPHENEVGGSVILTWSSIDPDGEGPCGGTSDDVEIFFNEPAQAYAGEDLSTCNLNMVVLSATANGPGYWSGGLGTFEVPSQAVTIYTPHITEVGSDVTLYWTTLDTDGIGPCTEAVDHMELTVLNCEACPDIVSVSADTEGICSNSVFTLSAITTGANSTIAWYHQDGTPIQNPNQVYVENTSCEAIDVQFYAVLTPSISICNPVTMYTQSVTIYPEIQAQTDCNSCSASVSVPCDNFIVTWEDTQGNSGVGTEYFTNAINSGTVYFLITDPNNEDDRECSELELSCNYSCDGCPVLNNAMTTANEICSGQSVSLSVDVLNDDGGILEWYMNGELVTDPNNVVLQSTSCAGELYEFTAVYTPDFILCDQVSMTTEPILVFPDIIGNTYVYEDQCTIGVNYNCGNAVVYWLDNLGNTGLGDVYTTDQIGPGWVEFTVVNPLLDYPGCECLGTACHSATFLQSFNCACEPEYLVAVGDGIACSGESITLADIVGLENVNQFSWYENGEEILFESVLLTNNTCESIVRTIVVTENNDDLDCDPLQQFEMNYVVFPDVDGEVISNSGSCSVIFNPDCDNYEVHWYTNDAQLGTGTVFTPEIGSSGEVTFVVQYDSDIPFALDCMEDAVTVPYNCCNELPNLSAVVDVACSGSLISLDDYLNLPDDISVEWVHGDQIIENHDILPINEGCQSISLNYQGNYSIPTELCTQYYQYDLTLIIYPAIEAEIVRTGDDCHFILNTECEEYFDISWYLNDDVTGEGSSFSAENGQSGLLTFVVQNPEIEDYNLPCASSAYETEFNCYDEVPVIDLELTKETITLGELNAGDTFSYMLSLFNNSNSNATNIVVDDLFPFGLTLLEANATIGSFNDDTFEWSLASLGAGETAELELVVQIQDHVEGVIINYAQVVAANEMDLDSYPANNNPEEDDQDFIAISVNGNLLPCEEIDICVEPITPIVICPDFCSLGDGIEIVDANTLYYCSILVNDDCITYTPLPGLEQYGSDFIEILACDDSGNCETVTVNVTIGDCGNDLIAVDDYASISCEQTVNILVLLNDIEAHANSVLSITSVEQPAFGATSIINNHIQYTAPMGFEGIVVFDYVVADNYGNSDIGTVTVEVYGGYNSAPIAISDEYYTNYNESINLDVLANDIDVDPFHICNFTQPSNGLVNLMPDGTFNYHPANGFYGIDSFTYQICDVNNCGSMSSTYATVTIHVSEPPVDECFMTACAEPLQQIIICPEPCYLTGNFFIQDVTSAFYCSVQIIEGCVYYTPLPGMEEYGSDIVEIVVCNQFGQCETIIVHVTITEDCDPQIIELIPQNDFANIPCNHSDVYINVLANDAPANGVTIGQIVQPSNGTVSLFGDGLLYTPDAEFVGNVTFSYQAIYQDQSAWATVTVSVQSDSNNYPVTVNDYYSSEGESLTLNPLVNDFDPDGDVLSICDVADPLNGTIEQVGNQLVYTPNPGYTGPDSFKYYVCDNSPCGNLTSYAFIFINSDGTAPPGPVDCENESVEVCVESGSTLDICPSFCQFDENYKITSVQNVFFNETLILSDECFTYEPAEQFLGLDEVIIKACYMNSDGTLDIANCGTITYYVTTSLDCSEGGGMEIGATQSEEHKGIQESEALLRQQLMEIPNAFTPNNDGFNDIFKLNDFKEFDHAFDFEFTVFDRNGQFVYQQSGNRYDDINWNGEMDNQRMAGVGTYFYKLSFTLNDKTYYHTGFIELVR